MKMTRLVATLLLAGTFAWAFVAQAGETTFGDVSVDYGGASINWVDGELVLTYKSGSQLKIMDGAVNADILVVGGGGGGGRSSSTSSYYGSGNGGSVLAIANQTLLGGSYEIAVGSGGSGATSNGKSGSAGGESSLKGGSVGKTAAGGGGGGTSAAAGSPTTGTKSLITGASVFYGKGGVEASGSATAGKEGTNPGDGGTGNKKGANGGSGAKGIVVVRLKEAYAVLEDLGLRIGGTVSEFRDASDQPISFTYSEVTCKSSIDVVASVVETADGKVGVVGHMAGQSQIKIVAGGKTYLLVVTVNPLITGKIRVGAYEVDVRNASRTNWVDGDLVITYLDTTADKSFTLPQATTGRLLAVGGGGAGGQEPGKRDDTCGLPGGGGAGGMVVNDSQDFAAATYAVVVGAGGVAPRNAPTSATAGADGAASTVTVNGETLANALGGGGGGARSAGNAGGSGGGGSNNGSSQSGGAKQQASPGFGCEGGKGEHKLFGAGGGGAGGAGGGTASYSNFYSGGKFADTTSENVYLSGAGGQGKSCDITGESVEYARGGAGGVPRLYAYYYSKGGTTYYTNTKPTDTQKDQFDNKKYFWCEASDGKPGRDGYGDGGGGGSYYSTLYGPTFAGSGGNGVVIVRIPPYKTAVEDALKAAFVDQPVTVSDRTVTLTGDVTGPICIPDNLGAVTIKLNGHAIIGADGADGDDITPGGDGQPALKIVPHEYDCESGVTILSVTGSGSLKGGNGGKGYPGGSGVAAVAAEGFTVAVADGIAVTAGTAGESLVQHPHQWVYTVEDNKIVAYCVAYDGETCSYRDDHSRGPFVAISAADAAYTALRYDELTAVNGITPVTGVVIAPETYVGRGETVYPESSTPPREQGAYSVSMQLGDLRITSDFTITEPKPSQGSVYQAWKTAERKGRDVQIALSATFDGSKAINDGNVLFLGSRCSAHSMAGGTVESSVNAMTRYASVRWYAYGSSDPENNLVDRLTKKGETVSETVPLTGGNHFVHKEMMDDLYAELVEKKNLADGYDLIILEFDGDLLCRDGASPYELVYSLPKGWTDEKAAQLRAAMSRYYAEDRVVWIVPDVSKDKDDAGYTGEYPWMSNPEFIWQRAFLNATETEGYKCPLQKNYEDTNALVGYLQEVLVGHFFSNAIIKDTLANGLTIKKVTPQMRSDGGIWRDFNGGPEHYTIFEPRSEKNVKADVKQTGRQVEVTFDMREEQAWACENEKVIGDDLRVVIDAELDPAFFSGVGEGESQETNEGPATFDFTESNLDGEETYALPTIEKDSPTIKNEKLTPDYTAEDVVRIYDGKGTNIVVKPIAPEPENAIIRYSLDEHGTYTDTLALTDVCDRTKVWFTITDKVGEFTTVTNFATVTILPRVVVEQAEDATKAYDGAPLMQPAHSNVLSRAIAEAEQMYPGRGASAAGFVTGEGFASVPMTADSQQTEAGSHANTIDRNAVTVNDKTDKNNYVFIYLPGTLTVTPPLPMGIAAFPVEKFYDAEPTNVTWVVTNSTGAAITDATISLREKGTDPWIPAADFAQYVDTTNVMVEVKAEKAGFASVTAEATVLVKPRPVTLVAGSDSKTYDGTPLTCDEFEVKDDETTAAIPGYGFVKDEGVASVTMTPESTVTEPGSVPNVIASETAKEGTKLERNYVVSTEKGTLTVTDAAMGIQAFPVEKFYDAEPTNVTWTVTNATGAVISDATISLREKGTDPWIPAADFVRYVDTTNVTVQVRAEKDGFTAVEAEATVLVKPRPVTLVAGSDSKTYDGTPLTCDNFEVKDDETTAAIPGYGFVKDEGVASVTMTPESTVTDPGSVPNVIASETAKEGTKLERNYVVSTEKGTLTVTDAAMGIQAFPVEKFYDAEPTNITWTVTNAAGAVISDATISLREKGTDPWIPATDFVRYVDTTNVTVQVKAEKTGYTSVETEAMVLVKPRPVTLVAGSDSKTYDGTPLTCDEFEVKDDETTAAIPGYGFVKEEGVASVTMTPESTVTDPGSVPNVIASETAKAGTKLERNYVVSTEKGTLTVTDAAMGIQAFPVEKFYDAEATNITWVVTNAAGAVISDATISLREKGTDPWVPAADFALYVDTTNVTVQVKAEKTGYTSVETEATLLVKPRPVTLVAGSDSKTYDGTPLTCDEFEVKDDETTAAIPGYGFVKEEGVASVTMTPESTVTDPGSVPNVIASETAKEGTKLERNYVVSTEKGTLTVTDAAMGIQAFPVEKFYDAEPTNITWTVTNATGAAITDATISLREKGTDPWIPATDFVRYVDTTNVTVQVRAEKDGFTAVEAEAVVVVKPRPVTLVAGSASKTYDGTPLTCDTFTVKEGTASEYGFVGEEGVASVTMTPESTITDPGSKPNEIASETAKPGTKLDRNYVVTTEPGTLTVTAAAFTASAEPVEKFYDSTPTNIVVKVSGVPDGVTPTYEYSYSETEGYVPAADFAGPTNVSETATVWCRVIIPGTTNVVSAVATIKPRIVVSHAKDGEWAFDGAEHAQPDYYEDADDEAERSKAKWGTDEALPDSTGFVEGEGYADDLVMTEASKITDPGSVPNVIDTAADKVALAANTKPENYELYYLDGTLKVKSASFTASADPVEKFYDSEPTNIIVKVSGVPAGVTPTYEYSYSETEGYVPAADFAGPTNVSETATVWCRVIIPGTTNVVSAVATIKPRIVVSHAKDGEWAFDGAEHAQPDYYEDADDEAERSKAKWGTDEALPDSTGFVDGEGYADDLVMTDASRITNPGSVPNVIDTAADKVALAANTKAENYELYYLDGTLKVTPASFTASADPVEKFYDSTPTNIIVTVSGIPAGVTPTYEYSYSETEGFVPAADFTGPTNVSETATVYCRVIIPGATNVVSAVATIKPRIVVSHAKDGEWAFDGAEHAQPDYYEDADDEAERSKAKWGTDEALPDSTGFVDGEGYADDLVMTDASRITNPGSVPNVIDTAADKVALAANTKAENYELYYLDGTLKVTPASFTASAEPVEKFYDSEPTNIIVKVSGIPSGVTPTYEYSYSETEGFVPAADFTGPTNVSETATVWCRVIIPGATNVVSAVATIKPRIVVEQAESASKIFDGTPLVQPNHHEETDVEAEKSKAKWGTNEVLANSTGFVAGEGFADVPMTAGSTITEPGVEDNVIDVAEVALAANTKPGNYIFFYLPGELAIIQRQEEVRRDPEVEIPEEAKEVVEESDKKIEKALDEMAKSDQEATGETYVKYQLTVTPTNHLDETTRTTPEKAAEDAKKQIEKFKREVPDARVDKVEFVDIVLERTYSKEEAEATAAGDYNKDNWESLDKAEEHGNRLLEVTIPVDVPEGMELVGVTRSCDNRGTEILLPKDPDDPDAEGFVYDPETKTVTLYAKEFCVFGFMMKTESPVLRPDGDEDLCSCDEKKARTYEGTIISEELGVIGSVTATVSRPNKKGVSTVKAKVNSRFQTGNLCFSTKVEVGDCVCSETEGAMVIDCCCCCRKIHHELVLRFEGDTMTGWFDGDGRIDGGIDVFKTKGDPRGAAMADRVGTWTGVFDVNEADGTSGFGTFGVTIKKSGAVSIQCKMPDGTAINATSKYQVGEDGIGIVPVILRKGLCGNKKIRGFGFRLVFRPGETTPRAYDVSSEQIRAIYGEALTDMGTIGAIEVGRVAKMSSTVVRMTVQGAGDLSAAPDEIKVKVNKSTNALSGKCTWVSLDKRGKAVKTVGTITSGCVVNGVGYGMLRIRGMGLRPFTCTCE